MTLCWILFCILLVTYEYSLFRLLGRFGGLKSNRDLVLFAITGFASAALMPLVVIFFNLP